MAQASLTYLSQQSAASGYSGYSSGSPSVPAVPAAYADAVSTTDAWSRGGMMIPPGISPIGDSIGHSRTDSGLSRPMAGSFSAASGHSSGAEPADADRRQRRARRTLNGQTVVTTPWFPDGAIKEQVTLSSEVVALAKLLSLNLKERAARNTMRSHFQEAAQKRWPDATVKVYGSFAYDCSLPDSALDLVCENCVDLQNFKSCIQGIAEECHVKIEHLYEQQVEGERHAFAKLNGGECNVVVNVTFVENRSPARQAVQAVRKLLSQFPAARDVFSCVRQVLRQSGVADAADGGLAPYAVLLMVFHAAQRSGAPHDPGQLLVDFFTLYSAASTGMIDARRRDCAPKQGKRSMLWVSDIAGDGNVADGCIKAPQVHTVCAYCASTLAKWSSEQWDGYRGRSPLSSILAYDVLWERANA
eukprot:TRINITY_DN4910_c0_g1_i1.p1 TRINITY_DN4910_c0_g1~~TRINITY_DN4910_c0_g1_i1.p1  ORF type:complete len:456 (+),score=126.81 TRINITY_DN4910_c0_g1_i1:123-1370(+)